MFKKKSLDTILSSFTKVVEDLDVYMEETDKEVGAIQHQVDLLQAKSLSLCGDYKRADNVRGKIKSLMD